MGAFDRLIAAATRKYGLPPDYLAKLIQYESRSDPNAVSKTGVRGLAQITSDTGKSLGLNKRNFTNPEAQIDAAARLAQRNYGPLKKALGREPTSDELYLGHLQGAGGASSAFRNPNARAIDILDPYAVRVNLPKSQRSRLNTITAKEYQDIHRGNFNRAGKGTVDIGDQPDLKTLNPPKSDELKPIFKIPLSQLAPTEQSNTMARYPDYDEILRQEIKRNPELVRLAGAIPPGAIKPKITKAPKAKKAQTPENAAVRKKAEEEAPLPQREGPYDRTAPGTRGMEGGYGDYTKREKARMEGEAKRAKEIKSVPSAAEQIGSPANPRGVKSERILPTGPAAALGAAGVGAAAVGGGTTTTPVDPAVQEVMKSIAGSVTPEPPAAQNDPNLGPALAQRARGGGPRVPSAAETRTVPPEVQRVQETIGASVGGGAGQDSGQVGQPGPQAQQYNVDPAAQMVEQALGLPPGTLANPNTSNRITSQLGPLIQDVMKNPRSASAVQEVVKTAIQGKAQRDARQADMRNDPTFYQQQASRGQAPGGMQDDRAMERAVMMDNPGNRMPMQTAPAAGGGVDPAMMQLMQFFTGGGGVG